MAFTFFMRDQPILEHAVDLMIRSTSGRSRIRVWDAGCAQGQETWTLAMILAERMNPFRFRNLRIDATDHDSANRFGDLVTAAVYSAEELQRTPRELRDRYFEPAGKPDHFSIVESLRSRVSFRYHDLLSLKPPMEDYCLVVCKNVLLHFSYAQRVDVFRMFHRALAPGGHLATENTQKLPPEVAHLFTRAVANAQVYRKIGGGQS
ncbi:CheR family methyltransferase [Pelobacter propionicus]|uniref:MCP methyltransferase, CheR-type n=1 Tax=Pelobacter propionicus (strain DSM 2379 / NBRC 103807 / OttBd1) TaxID=338966 RepID=A1ASJ3_PELPD|nr:CheR family methyltransferase [Pelobacter propionicus]ABL00314.1 MCP methyltransferase, CheR-type [Pelobacter propionicus DSM 2379]